MPIKLQMPLPEIPIPLRSADTEISVDLQGVFNRVYDEARYALRIHYQQPMPLPKLSAEDQAWVDSLGLSK